MYVCYYYVVNKNEYIIVYTEYRRVTERQTDGQTSCHGIVRAMHTRRAVKILHIFASAW